MKVLFIFFAAACILQRILETKLHRRIKGRKTAGWTLGLMSLAHALCFAGAPMEGLALGRAVLGFWSAAGFLLFLAAFLTRRWVIQTLGGYWSVNIEIRENHPLITTGPFSYCRHPNYFSILMEIFGYCMIFQAWGVLALTVLIYLPAIYFRVRVEEREMIRHFGGSYERYIEQVPTLLPIAWTGRGRKT